MSDNADFTTRRHITAIETAVVGGITLALGASLGVLRKWPSV